MFGKTKKLLQLVPNSNATFDKPDDGVSGSPYLQYLVCKYDLKLAHIFTSVTGP